MALVYGACMHPPAVTHDVNCVHDPSKLPWVAPYGTLVHTHDEDATCAVPLRKCQTLMQGQSQGATGGFWLNAHSHSQTRTPPQHILHTGERTSLHHTLSTHLLGTPSG